MHRIKTLLNGCRVSDSSLPLVIGRHIRYRIAGKNVLANNRVIIKGLRNIHTNGLLKIGMGYVGFVHKHDRTYLNINGSLVFGGAFHIGKGCRFDIGEGAVARFGTGVVNAESRFVIMHGLTVGDGCVISWGCEFLDEDFHQITYNGRRTKAPSLEVGSHVWLAAM